MKNKLIKSLMNSLNSRERERERSGGLSMKKESNGIGENKNSKKINKNNKIISSILAIAMCCQSLVGAVPLNTDGKVNVVAGPPVSDSIDSENNLKDSKGKDEGDNKDFIKKKEDSRNTIKDNFVKSTIFVGSVVGHCCLGIYYIATELCSRNFHNHGAEQLAVSSECHYNAEYHKEIISKYLDASSEYHSVPADTWFQRLGGKQEDIDKYYERREELEKKINCMSNKERYDKGIDVIKADYLRPGSHFKDKKEYYVGILKRILEIGVLDDIDYLQGYDRYATLAIIKFFIYNPPDDLGSKSEKEKETEAKAYYVYKTIVRTVEYNVEGVLRQKSENAFTFLFLKILKKYFIKCPGACELVDDAEEIVSYVLFYPFLTSGISSFTTKQSIKIWDSIILNDNIVKEGNFSPERAQEQILTIVVAFLLKVYSDANFVSQKYVGLEETMVKDSGGGTISLLVYLKRRIDLM
ncbi:MAG: hypothetical protein CfP315_0281 [Candidatus Improbicoccus pseudotrichonymphae]|uniref:Uncharacterized protein n=1 Tax=Candidatus Improbicoccus pseudotrichonymphae TaxID=3033792 RepID=A0AA48HUS3_9FIRM|nr:MAG: hypothetical protein CfP315_0281 [Candidatus Improbicoccus pseudotrichonymphae]